MSRARPMLKVWSHWPLMICSTVDQLAILPRWKLSGADTNWESSHGDPVDLWEKQSLLEDGSIQLDQKFYTESRVQPIAIPRDRKRRKFSLCNPDEVEQLRALIGVPSWLSKETRCDLAGKTALLQQSFPKPLIRDLIAANQLAKEALDHKALGIRVMPIPLDRLRAGVVTIGDRCRMGKLKRIWHLSWTGRKRLVGRDYGSLDTTPCLWSTHSLPSSGMSWWTRSTRSSSSEMHRDQREQQNVKHPGLLDIEWQLT